MTTRILAAITVTVLALGCDAQDEEWSDYEPLTLSERDEPEESVDPCSGDERPLGCACEGTDCADGLMCNGAGCTPCPPGSPGCPCDGNYCEIGECDPIASIDGLGMCGAALCTADADCPGDYFCEVGLCVWAP